MRNAQRVFLKIFWPGSSLPRLTGTGTLKIGLKRLEIRTDSIRFFIRLKDAQCAVVCLSLVNFFK